MRNGTSHRGFAAGAAVLGLLLAAGTALAGPAGRRGGAAGGELRGALEALDLSDGTTLSMIGIQGSDGARARRAVRELRALVASHSPS